MALRRPLVTIAGVVQELPLADTLPDGPFLDLTDTAPATPPAGTVRMFRRELAGSQMPAFIDPSGLEMSLQPGIARNKIGVWQPGGNSTAVPGLFGMMALTPLGTAANRGWASTDAFTRMKRLGYVSAATAAAFSGIRLGASQISTGTGAGLGGFFIVQRFAITDAVIVTDARTFAGISNSSAAPTNVEPSTLLNCIGVGHGAADANMKIFYGGSAAQTPIDLGAGFPKSLNIPYELILVASPRVANTINWQVTRLDTGATVAGSVTGAAAVIPQSSMGMTPFQIWRCNNATLAAAALDIISLYVGTDN